jgi:anti-anti-sigma factor
MTDLRTPSSARDVVDEFAVRRRRRSTGPTVLDVVGDIDLLTAPLLLEAARDELEVGCRALELDLLGVTFCSVRGLRTLLEVRRLVEGHGATVRIDHASAAVRRIADLLQTCDLIDSAAPDAPPEVTRGGSVDDPRERGAEAVPHSGATRRRAPTPVSAGFGGTPRVRHGRRPMAPRGLPDVELLYGWPVLVVVHDADGAWHFLPHIPTHAREMTPTSARRASWTQLVAMDASLHELAGLPRGWIAARERRGRPWQRRPG